MFAVQVQSKKHIQKARLHKRQSGIVRMGRVATDKKEARERKPLGVKRDVKCKNVIDNKEAKKLKTLAHAFLDNDSGQHLEFKKTLGDVKVDQILKEELDEKVTKLLEKLSPKHLRKFCLHYFRCLTDGGRLEWREMLESVRMPGNYALVAELLLLLHRLSGLHSSKTFKIGHILVTTQQSELIKMKGMRPVRDGPVKKGTWRIPVCWQVEKPEEDLGEGWGQKEDSQLIIGASQFGTNIKLIVADCLNLKSVTLDAKGDVKESVKRRFAYLINVYQNRGVFNEEFALNLVNYNHEDGGTETDVMVDDTLEGLNRPSGKEKETMEEKKSLNEIAKLVRPVSDDFELHDSYYEDDYTEDYNDSFMEGLQATVLETMHMLR